MTLRAVVATLLGLLLYTAASGQATQDYKWEALPSSNRILVNGVAYSPESAGQTWSILRARGLKSDLYRFEVRRGDVWNEDARGGNPAERSEFDGWATSWTEGTDVWCAYSFFLESGRVFDTSWTAIGQLHGRTARYSPLFVGFNKELVTVGTWIQTANNIWSPLPLHTENIPREVWHNVVYHYRASIAGKGLIEFWLNSKKVVDFKGSVGGVAGDAVYWKYGIYRGYGPIDTPLAIRYANMEVGTKNLTARILSPAQID